VRELVHHGHEVLTVLPGERSSLLDDADVRTLRLDRDRSVAELVEAVDDAVCRYAPDIVIAASE
jgi:hypothetical protein